MGVAAEEEVNLEPLLTSSEVARILKVNQKVLERWAKAGAVPAFILLTDHIKPAAAEAKIGKVGWHTFRHTYSSLLHAFGTVPVVQKAFVREATAWQGPAHQPTPEKTR